MKCRFYAKMEPVCETNLENNRHSSNSLVYVHRVQLALSEKLEHFHLQYYESDVIFQRAGIHTSTSTPSSRVVPSGNWSIRLRNWRRKSPSRIESVGADIFMSQ